ncbi:MAG: AGE family epimerase/isomerase, partial [Saprospiraceae bacterium]|nr:AGE family epimerase/isomerase [Saprospiraceae bacterium]
LSQYAKINPQPTVTDWISKVLEWMEETAHDPQHGGYFNLITPDARSARSPGFDPIELYDAGWGAPNWKDQNSSIHLLEALTTTYQVLPDSLARERLEEMLLLVRDTMVRHSGSLHLYFQRDWTPVSHKDSSRSYIIENLGLDHISFGHDIETAFLLLDASKTLYGDYDGDTKKIAKQMVDHTLDHGFDDNYEGMFDRGYLFNDAKNIEILNRERIWWAEAEAWHTLTLMSHQYPNDPRYRDAALSMWNYIQSYQIDSTYGGWYSKGIDLNPESEVAPKGNQWKGCYHDGRSLMQVHLYLNREIR